MGFIRIFLSKRLVQSCTPAISSVITGFLVNFTTNDISVNGKLKFENLTASKSFWMLIIQAVLVVVIAAVILKIKQEEENTIDKLQCQIAVLEDKLRKRNMKVVEALDRKAEEIIIGKGMDFDEAIEIFRKWKVAVNENSDIS